MFLMAVYTVNCSVIFLCVLFRTLTRFYSGLASKSVKAKLLLDQLSTLRGEVGHLRHYHQLSSGPIFTLPK